jgi:hypothetical protein
MKYPKTFSYLITIVIGLLFASELSRIIGYGANLMPSLNYFDWTKNNLEISKPLLSFFSYGIPLAIISLTIGFALSILPYKKIVLFVAIASAPSILLFFIGYIYSPMSIIGLFEAIISSAIIIICLIFPLKKNGSEQAE